MKKWRGWVAAVLSVPTLAFAMDFSTIVQNPKSALRTWEVRHGGRAFVLLHGYGSAPQQWLPFAETIHIARETRFVFPQGPEVTVPPDGPVGGRAWWRIDLASFLRPGETVPDLSRARPAGLGPAATRIRRLLGDLKDRAHSVLRGQTILGGFSQGAMISADVAFSTDEPLKALVLLSGTFVDEAGWTKAMARRAGLPVFLAHGRQDKVLGFDSAVRLRDAMRRAGLRVTWVPFEGAHEIPAEVVTALNGFLAAVE